MRGRWVPALGYVVGTLFAFVTKRELQAFIQHRGPAAFEPIAKLADYLGSGTATVAFGSAALVFGWLARKQMWVDAALALGTRGIPCWILTKAGQLVLAESRPNEGGSMHWLAFGGHGVSGHAAAAALVFWTVHDVLLKDARPHVRGAITVGSLGWVLVVGWSRVYLGQHFVWNVMLGYLVGTVPNRFRCTKSTTSRRKRT